MNDTDLINLELQIESLLQSREQLLTENLSLRRKLVKLTQERAELLDKNKKAAVKIKRVISHLRNETQ